jgi:acetyl-CoA C-acetyltransferase
MKTEGLVCVAAKRSPLGRFGGEFRDMPSYDIAAQVIRKMLAGINFDPAKVDEVLIGNCRQAGNGPNPGRTASVRGGIPESVPVTTINMACPSGMKGLETAGMRLKTGNAKFVLVGGMDSMSTMPFMIKGHRWKGFRFGDKKLLDGWADSVDPLIDTGMGGTAENLNDKYRISREEQDQYAAASQEKAHNAWEQGHYTAEVVPIEVDDTEVVKDSTYRYPVNLEKMGKLPPVFRKDGTVTAGNACAMADGAAFMLLTTKEIAEAEGLTIRCEMPAFSQAAVDPAIMGVGPAHAIPLILDETGMRLNDVDLLEVNEAFAVQILANERDLKWDRSKLNVHGGAIALGHPTGCTGVRIVVTLLHAMEAHGRETGIASLCGAGGVTMATFLRRS